MKAGDTVRLDSNSIWNNGFDINPLDIEGVVISVHNCNFGIKVIWKNGKENVYNQTDLIVVCEADSVVPLVNPDWDLISKYKDVVIGVSDNNSGILIAKMEQYQWTVINYKGIDTGIPFTGVEIRSDKKKKLIESFNPNNEIHKKLVIDRVKNNL